MQASPVSFRHYAAIFLVALVTIATQILISRIFSVTFYYHYAFGGITFAMLGLTAGALKVYQDPVRFSAERAGAVLAESGSRFALYLSLATLLHVWLPGVVGQWQNVPGGTLAMLCLLAGMIALLMAFIESGICIAILLTRFPRQTGRLYACDLTGAAIGCLIVIAALNWLDPASTLLILATALAIMAWRFLPATADAELSFRVKLLACVLGLVSVVQVSSYWKGDPAIRLTWAKGAPIVDAPLFERWNTYSRIAVNDYRKDTPFGWGFGREPDQKIEQKYLTIDADAGTILTEFDGDLGKVSYLRDDIINLGYWVRDISSVAVIGIGGGRDILSALVSNAQRIKGIELNPATVEALTKAFGDFTGHLDQRPEVSFATAEARSYLNSHEDVYDLIQISLIDTWATTAAGGLTLSENKLYTTDAWSDFLNRLSDKGMLVVSRWYAPEIHQGEYYRMLAIASDVIKAKDPQADPRKHLLAATVGWSERKNSIITLIVSKAPLSDEDIARFDITCRELRFTPLLTPNWAQDPVAAQIASGNTGQAFFDSLPLDVSASTDDRPFFFHMQRFGDMMAKGAGRETLNFQNNAAVNVLFLLFAITLLAGIAFIAWPLLRLYRAHQIRVADASGFMLYFAMIGFGFMLIEIAQMQRLMIFLGHPVYGLGVVLFTLLLSSGIGSYLRRNVAASDSDLVLWPALLCAVLVAIGLSTPWISEHLKYFDTAARVAASAVVIAVMGLFMGMMFPIGAALASVRQAHLLPWYWGINGAASVFASVLAVVLSLQYGIAASYWLGVVCYGVCLAVAPFLRRGVLAADGRSGGLPSPASGPVSA
jgi:hypothetical protein